jgi:hypothetical protein
MRLPSRLVATALALSAGGCYLFHSPGESSDGVSEPDAGVCAIDAYKANDQFAPIDMVWVVDSSASMQDEQARIKQTMNQFVSDIESRSFDVHLVMITNQNLVPAPLGTDTSRYRFVQRRVGSQEPLMALLDTAPQYRDFLRRDAALHFVVVTDDDSSMSAEEFMGDMTDALQRSFVLHAVASQDVDGQPCRSTSSSSSCIAAGGGARLCGAAAIGRVYYDLAARTGGEEISICLDDWSMVFGPLAAAVSRTQIPCVIDVSANGEAITDVSVRRANGSALAIKQVSGPNGCGTADAFYMTRLPQGMRVSLGPAACAATSAADVELRIAHTCDQGRNDTPAPANKL